MNAPFADATLPTELAVVGENRDDPTQLLLLGDDGFYYVYALLEGVTRPIEPDDQWTVEWTHDDDLFA